MTRRFLRTVLLLGIVGCSDSGPEVPILFVKPPTGSNGAGTITSAPGGISCTISNQTSVGRCSANFETGAAVTLTAAPAAGSTFSGWGEACDGTDPTCDVTLDANADVTAAFALANPRRLTVAGTGTGSGTITSIPGGLNCVYNGTQTSGTCAADFADGATVTVTAAPALGTGFNTWSDDCASAGATTTCDVTMSADRSAGAEFVSVSFSGLLASAGDDRSGLIVVNIPTASASVRRTAPSGVSLSLTANDVVAVGTVRFLGGTASTVAGTYNTETKVLSLASGSGFDLTASFSGEALDGLFFDAGTGIGGPATLVPTPANAPAAVYCGTFAGQDAGSWNVAIAGSLVSGNRSATQGGSRSMVGSLTGDAISLAVYTGVPPDSTGTGSATGTLSTDRASITGTWTELSGTTGTWQASTAACQ